MLLYRVGTELVGGKPLIVNTYVSKRNVRLFCICIIGNNNNKYVCILKQELENSDGLTVRHDNTLENKIRIPPKRYI